MYMYNTTSEHLNIGKSNKIILFLELDDVCCCGPRAPLTLSFFSHHHCSLPHHHCSHHHCCLRACAALPQSCQSVLTDSLWYIIVFNLACGGKRCCKGVVLVCFCALTPITSMTDSLSVGTVHDATVVKAQKSCISCRFISTDGLIYEGGVNGVRFNVKEKRAFQEGDIVQVCVQVARINPGTLL